MKSIYYCRINFVVLFILFINYNNNAKELFINEIMTSNQSYLTDEDGDNSDWIEIYNHSDKVILLNNYFLSDNPKNISKWKFPNIEIKPKEYLLIFCSNKDKKDDKFKLHTNFALDSDGEDLILSKNNEIIHSLPPIKLSPNTSYGLIDLQNNKFDIFDIPTPKTQNIKNENKNEIIFSHNTGVYPKSFHLNLKLKISKPKYKIHYTVDGNRPTIKSKVYENELYLDEKMYSDKNINQIKVAPDIHFLKPKNEIPKCIVIKAAVFDELGNLCSETSTKSYLFYNLINNYYIKNQINSTFNFSKLPVVSITANYEDLFDYEKGIMVPGVNYDSLNPVWSGNYNMRGEEWERSAYLNFIDTNGLSYEQNIGIRIHGNASRSFLQKSFRLYARNTSNEIRKNTFNFDLFHNKNKNERLIIRAMQKGWSHRGYDDYICKKYAKKLNIDVPEIRPCIVFLNGEFWGVNFIQERFDDKYYKVNKNISSDSLDIINWWEGDVLHGNVENFMQLVNFIKNNDLTNEQNYKIVSEWIDIDNFIDYQIINKYVANIDWPAHNLECWRERKNGRKWRWVFADGDATFSDYKFDAVGHAFNQSDTVFANSPTATLFLRKLSQNKVFFQKFIDRYKYLLNNELDINNLQPEVNNIRQVISEIIEIEMDRFNFPYDKFTWNYSNKMLDSFLIKRKCVINELMIAYFNENLGISECLPYVNDLKPDTLNVLFETKLFPNPSNDVLTLFLINYENKLLDLKDIKVEIIDFNGNIFKQMYFDILNQHTFIQTIDIQELPNGIYFINLTSNNIKITNIEDDTMEDKKKYQFNKQFKFIKN